MLIFLIFLIKIQKKNALQTELDELKNKKINLSQIIELWNDAKSLKKIA